MGSRRNEADDIIPGQIKTCLKANVAIFQDGYIECGIINTFGCQRCYEEWEEKSR